MLKPSMRDEIRALAEVPGATTMVGLLNRVIQESIDALTGLAKYDELYTIDTSLAIAANGVVSLPPLLQHLDLTQIYFLVDGSVEIQDKYRLHPFTRKRITSFGRASQWRIYGTDVPGANRKLQITPFVDIDTTDDRVMINYWRRYIWESETSEFLIPKLEETIILRAAARICKGDNSRLAAKLAGQSREAYAAARAASIVS